MKQIIPLVIIGLIIGFAISFFTGQRAGENEQASVQKIDDLGLVADFLTFSVGDVNDCLDGRAVDYYFEESSLPTPGTVKRVNLPQNIELAAVSAQHCSDFRYAVKSDDGLEEVEQRDKFENFVAEYPETETNQLLIMRTGSLQSGFIFPVGSNEFFCYAGEGDVDYCED